MDKSNGNLPISLKKDDGIRSTPMSRRGISAAGAYMGCAGKNCLSFNECTILMYAYTVVL